MIIVTKNKINKLGFGLSSELWISALRSCSRWHCRCCTSVSTAEMSAPRRLFEVVSSIRSPGGPSQSKRRQNRPAEFPRTAGKRRSTRDWWAASLRVGGCQMALDCRGRTDQSCARSTQGRLQAVRLPVERRCRKNLPWHMASQTYIINVTISKIASEK